MLYDILCVPLLRVRSVQHRQISDFVLYLHRKLNNYAYSLLKQLYLSVTDDRKTQGTRFQHNSEVSDSWCVKVRFSEKSIVWSEADSNCRPLDYIVGSMV